MRVSIKDTEYEYIYDFIEYIHYSTKLSATLKLSANIDLLVEYIHASNSDIQLTLRYKNFYLLQVGDMNSLSVIISYMKSKYFKQLVSVLDTIDFSKLLITSIDKDIIEFTDDNRYIVDKTYFLVNNLNMFVKHAISLRLIVDNINTLMSIFKKYKSSYHDILVIPNVGYIKYSSKDYVYVNLKNNIIVIDKAINTFIFPDSSLTNTIKVSNYIIDNDLYNSIITKLELAK